MDKSSAAKIFFAFLLIFASGCNFWRATDTVAHNTAPIVVPEIKSEIPFSTREPDVYQTLAVTQSYAADGKTEKKVFTARDGARRLTIFNVGEKEEISLLELGTNQTVFIRHSKKIYTENYELTPEAEQTNIFLGWELLNLKTPATFESLGAENGLSKFRVTLGSRETVNSEILIYVDDDLKLPIKQEFYSLGGDRKTLALSVEMKDFKLSADENLFQTPTGYRKVSSKQFQESYGVIGK